MPYLTYFSGSENDPLQEFRTLCADSCDRLGERAVAEPIKRITAVGAEYREHSFGYNDELYLQMTLDWFECLGLPISKDFELTPLNLSYGSDQDFIDPNLKFPPADLLVICNVLDSPSGNFFGSSEYLCTSQYSIFPDYWHRAAERSGAKAIVAMQFTGSEVGKKRFQSDKDPIYKVQEMPFRHPLLDRYNDAHILLSQDLSEAVKPQKCTEGIAQSWRTRPWARILPANDI